MFSLIIECLYVGFTVCCIAMLLEYRNQIKVNREIIKSQNEEIKVLRDRILEKQRIKRG